MGSSRRQGLVAYVLNTKDDIVQHLNAEKRMVVTGDTQPQPLGAQLEVIKARGYNEGIDKAIEVISRYL